MIIKRCNDCGGRFTTAHDAIYCPVCTTARLDDNRLEIALSRHEMLLAVSAIDTVADAMRPADKAVSMSMRARMYMMLRVHDDMTVEKALRGRRPIHEAKD